MSASPPPKSPPPSKMAQPPKPSGAAVPPGNSAPGTPATMRPRPISPPSTSTPVSPATPRRQAKTFSVQPWTDTNEGTKILLYANSGMGKTTLASLAPNPIFLGLDDGGRKIKHPVTGADINAIPGVLDFRDVRDALRQDGLFPVGSTIVIDTVTRLQAWAELYTFDTIKVGKETPTSLEDYGYGKGYNYLCDTMRLILSDLEPHVRRGVNILLLAQEGQATVANLTGKDYLKDGPKLHAKKDGTGVRGEYIEWCDHVLRIGHPEITVLTDNQKATKGKAAGTTERVIYAAKELHFEAKTRLVNGQEVPPVVSFSDKKDDSIWQFLFPGGK